MCVGGAVVKLNSCLKLFRITLEIWYVSTHPYVVSENITFSTKAPLILLMSAFSCKKSAFLAIIVLLLKVIV